MTKHDGGGASRNATATDAMPFTAGAGEAAVDGAKRDIDAEVRRRAPRSRLAALARLVDPGSARRTHAVVSPFTGRDIARVPWLDAADVQRAAEQARAAQPEWARRSWGDRAAVIKRFHDLVLARQHEVMDLVQTETGKARMHAFAEVVDACLVARHYAFHGRRLLSDRRRRGLIPVLTSVREHRVPRGLVGILSTWNYPLSIGICDALPALLAGNAVILKPDERTPFTALWCLEQLLASGLPAGLFQVVIGSGPEVGEAVIHAADHIDFTGSTATGRRVAALAGHRLISCSLELGGKNALVVLADADLDRAVEGAVNACFSSAGQLCVSSENIFVHRSLHDEFRTRFVLRVRRMTLGASYEFGTEMGSLISQEHLEKVERHVTHAVGSGARVLAGGRRRPDLGPWFFEPTVLEGVRAGMLPFDEETFGPVVSLYSFDDEDDLVQRVNASPYGLNASVWTRRPRRGRRLAARLHVGMVNINEAYGAAWGSVAAPMGGMKASGLGRRHGVEGIQKYTEAQTVAVQRVVPLGVSASRQRAFHRAGSLLLGLARRVPGIR